MNIDVSVNPEALIINRDNVEKGPAKPVPVLKSPTKLEGNPFKKPKIVHSPIL